MDLCKLDNFENISEMRKKTIKDFHGKRIGSIKDVIFDENLQLHSFLVSLGLKDKLKKMLNGVNKTNPLLPIDTITEIKGSVIRTDIPKVNIRSEESSFPNIFHTFNDMKKKMVLDDNKTKIGKICNMVFLPCGEVALIIHCSHAKQLIPNGPINDWGLLLPIDEINRIDSSNIHIKVKAENLEKTLNNHVIKNEDVNNYLNSIHDKNTAKVKVISHLNLGNYLH